MSGASRYASKMRSAQRAKGETFEDRIDGVLSALADFTQAWEVIGEVWAEREKTIFATSSYGRWAPVTGATMRDKFAFGETELLVRTGHLKNALTNPNPRAMGDRFAVYGPPTTTSPEVISYGTRHAKGTKTIPRRNPVPKLTGTERRDVLQIMRWFLLPDAAKTSSKAKEVLPLSYRLRAGL